MKSFSKYISEQTEIQISDFSDPTSSVSVPPSNQMTDAEINQVLIDAGVNPPKPPSEAEPKPGPWDDYEWAKGTLFFKDGSMGIPCGARTINCGPSEAFPNCPEGYTCFPCELFGTCQEGDEEEEDYSGGCDSCDEDCTYYPCAHWSGGMVDGEIYYGHWHRACAECPWVPWDEDVHGPPPEGGNPGSNRHWEVSPPEEPELPDWLDNLYNL